MEARRYFRYFRSYGLKFTSLFGRSESMPERDMDILAGSLYAKFGAELDRMERPSTRLRSLIIACRRLPVEGTETMLSNWFVDLYTNGGRDPDGKVWSANPAVPTIWYIAKQLGLMLGRPVYAIEVDKNGYAETPRQAVDRLIKVATAGETENLHFLNTVVTEFLNAGFITVEEAEQLIAEHFAN